MTQPHSKTVAIIGAGPVGLAAAAHALERGMNPVVLEAGPEVGHAMRQWGHVQMFSTWEYNIDKAAKRLLTATGWNSPNPKHYTTGAEVVEEYLTPLVTRTALIKHIRTSARVMAVSRVGFDKVKSRGRDQSPFEIRYQNGSDLKFLLADAVIDASGTWFTPNTAGVNGLLAIGESHASDQITYTMPDLLGEDRQRYAGKTVAVLGAGHSAIGSLIDLIKLRLHAPETKVIWLMRGSKPEKSFGGGSKDQLAARGELGLAFAQLVRDGQIEVMSQFGVTEISKRGGRLRIAAGSSEVDRHVIVDELIVATGFRPDMSFLRELRTSLDPALECPPLLAPMIDPNEHSCGTVRPHGARELSQPEPGLYFAGMKSYGRAPTFLLVTGYEQVRSIVADIAGDHRAAERVELVLPETGVCNGPAPTLDSTVTGCCGGPAKHDAAACCVADEVAKEAGQSGCGCNTAVALPRPHPNSKPQNAPSP